MKCVWELVGHQCIDEKIIKSLKYTETRAQNRTRDLGAMRSRCYLLMFNDSQTHTPSI